MKPIVTTLLLLLLGFAAYGQGLNIRPPDPTPPATGSFEWKGDSLCVTLNGVQDCELAREYASGRDNLGSVSPGWNTHTINFGKTFDSAPSLTLTLNSNPPNHSSQIGIIRVRNVTNTGATVEVYANANTGGVFLQWQAILYSP